MQRGVCVWKSLYGIFKKSKERCWISRDIPTQPVTPQPFYFWSLNPFSKVPTPFLKSSAKCTELICLLFLALFIIMFAEEALVFVVTCSVIRVNICYLPHSVFDLLDLWCCGNTNISVLKIKKLFRLEQTVIVIWKGWVLWFIGFLVNKDLSLSIFIQIPCFTNGQN